MYEKSLSIRQNQIGYNKNSQDIWNYIFSFLESNDMKVISETNKLLTSHVIIYESDYWEKFGKDELCLIKSENENEKIKKKLTDQYNNKYFYRKLKKIKPKLIDQTKTKNTFSYKYDEFYICNKEALLRTVGMYALYLFGHDNDYRTYIANYYPENGEILACKLKWLLGCTFYGKKLYGQYYHIYNNYAYLNEEGYEIYNSLCGGFSHYDCPDCEDKCSFPLTIEYEHGEGFNKPIDNYECCEDGLKEKIENSFDRYVNKNIKQICGYSEYENEEIIDEYRSCRDHGNCPEYLNRKLVNKIL